MILIRKTPRSLQRRRGKEKAFAMLKLNMYFGFLLQMATCSFLGMEGDLTHIQEFLQLSDNVGIFYPYRTKVLQVLIPIEPQQTWMLRVLV